MKRVLIFLALIIFIGGACCGSLWAKVTSVRQPEPPDYTDYFDINEEAKARRAIATLEYMITNDPCNYENYMRLAFIYNYLGEYEKSLEMFESGEKYIPDDYEGRDALYGNLARGYLMSDRLDEAKAALDKAMEANPKNIINHIHLSAYYFKKGDIKNTAVALKKLNDLDPDRGHYYNFYNTFLSDDANPALISVFEEVVRLDPGNFESYRAYATALRNDFDKLAENFPLVEGTYQKAIELAPENIYNYIGLANAYWTRGLIEKDNKEYYFKIALDWLGKAKALDPDSYKVSFSLGNCYLSLGEHDKAIRHLEYALKNNSDDQYIREVLAEAYNNKAYSLYQSGRRLNEGLKLIDKAIGLDPDSGIFLSTKAELLYKLRRYEEAYEYIRKAIALEPENAEIKEDLANIREALKKKKKK